MTRKLILNRYVFYRKSIVIVTCIMLGLFQLFPNEIVGGYSYRFFVALYGCLLAISTISVNDYNFCQTSKTVNKLIGPYVICVLAAITNTQIMYHYSIHELIVAVMPYIYIFYAYPIIYLFCRDGSIEVTIGIIIKCTLCFLIIKGLIWGLYTFAGITLCPQILFEYGTSWVRNGNQRVNAGYLVGIALAYCVWKGFSGNRSSIYKFFSIYIIAFLWFVTAFRFQFIVAVTVLFMEIFFADTSKRNKYVNRIVIALFAIIVVLSPFVSDLIDSFKVNNATLGGSTGLRIMTISHFYNLMMEKNPIFGLGLLIADNPQAESILRMSQWRLFYLEDIGIIGAWFKLGVLIFGIYWLLFTWGAKDIIRKRKAHNINKMFMVGLVIYMGFSCLMLNIFDLQRAFDVPFYVALVCYHHSKTKNEMILINY